MKVVSQNKSNDKKTVEMFPPDIESYKLIELILSAPSFSPVRRTLVSLYWDFTIRIFISIWKLKCTVKSVHNICLLAFDTLCVFVPLLLSLSCFRERNKNQIKKIDERKKMLLENWFLIWFSHIELLIVIIISRWALACFLYVHVRRWNILFLMPFMWYIYMNAFRSIKQIKFCRFLYAFCEAKHNDKIIIIYTLRIKQHSELLYIYYFFNFFGRLRMKFYSFRKYVFMHS